MCFMPKKDKTLDHGVMASTSPPAIPNLLTKLICIEGKAIVLTKMVPPYKLIRGDHFCQISMVLNKIGPPH